MKNHAHGFTLVEVLVASVITALAMTLGYGALNQVIANRDRVHQQQERIDAVQRTLRILALDIAQAEARPVRDALGRTELAAFVADARTDTPLSLTRGGRLALGADARGTLERVDYRREDDALIRLAWPVLDRTQTTTARRRVLLRGVRQWSLRFLASDRTWSEQWPRAGERRLGTRPIAVEITLETADFGRIVRLVEVPG
ncbi:MAG: type II secretion system minor pseudopilin GspJ [Steroidobacteraceae bacterium]|jgi:general secretion pathway protein J